MGRVLTKEIIDMSGRALVAQLGGVTGGSVAEYNAISTAFAAGIVDTPVGDRTRAQLTVGDIALTYLAIIAERQLGGKIAIITRSVGDKTAHIGAANTLFTAAGPIKDLYLYSGDQLLTAAGQPVLQVIEYFEPGKTVPAGFVGAIIDIGARVLHTDLDTKLPAATTMRFEFT